MARLPFTLLALAVSILAPIASASSITRNPLGALSPVQNATIHTHNQRLTALSEFDLSFNIRDDLLVKLRLEPNHDVLGDDTVVTYLAPDGSITSKESVNRLQHRVYKGTAWVQRPSIGQNKWQHVGWARIFVTKDGSQPMFEGAFSVNHDHHHVQTSWNYMRTRHVLDPEIPVLDDEYLVLWRDSDILPNQLDHGDLKRNALGAMGTCLSDQLSFNTRDDHPVYLAMAKRSISDYGIMDFSSIFKRQVDSTTGGNSAGVNLAATVGQTAGCPTTRKVALVGVAMDCTYTADFNSSQTARENVISQMNTASAIWESSFNISLGLRDLTVSNASCPGTPAAATEWNQACSDSVNLQDRLNYFSAWRGNQRDNNSHWTLLSTCNTGSAVGLAWLGQACAQTAISTNGSVTGNGASNTGSETVTGANVVVRTQGTNEWQIIAHETGHTFGAVHDCTSETCADANFVNSQQCCPLSASVCDAGQKYIMNPAAIQGVQTFSMCTVGNICSALERNSVNSQCLTDNRGVTTLSGQVCGNGIVEPGEDCDCGGPSGCGDDTCCDPNTCKFTSGSVCDDANEDCCRGCQFASNGTVCRASTGQCDPQETCSGTSALCPADKTEQDGTSCGSGLECASGQCTSRDQQCTTVMGSYTNNNDTYACQSSGCTISCASPEFGRGVCYSLQQNFLDGTACGGGGRCQRGQCKGSTTGGEIRSWIEDNKEIVIGVCAAIGGLLLLAVLSCLFRCCTRRRRAPKVANGPPTGGWQGWNSAPQGHPPMQQAPYYPSQRSGQGWPNGNQPDGPWPSSPIPPPPSYPTRGQSVRYA